MISKLAQKYIERRKGGKLYPPLNNYSPFIQGSGYNEKKYFEKWYKGNFLFDILVIIGKDRSQVWLPDTEIRFFSSSALKEHLLTPPEFKKRVDFFYRNVETLYGMYPSLTYKELNKKEWNELIKLVSEIRDLIWESNAAVLFTIFLDKDFCWEIIEQAGFSLSRTKFDSMWNRATEAAFVSFDKEQLFDILSKISEGVPLKDIIEYSQYIGTDYYSAKSLSQIESILRERYGKYFDNSELARKTLTEEKEKLRNLENSHAEWVKSLSEEEEKLAYYLQMVMKLRDNRKNFFAKGLAVIYRIAERLFDESKVPKDLIPFFTMQELLKGEEYFKKIKNDIAKRREGIAFLVPFVEEPEIEFCSAEKAMEMMNKVYVEGHATDEVDLIKGQTGCGGKVKGVVRIVLDAESFGKFKQGEILVAGMTRPEYVPLMEKSLAVITDEGGITCHAAIISRELKIPCVIGTKVATKVLKDGSMVEVDADKGIVRKL